MPVLSSLHRALIVFFVTNQGAVAENLQTFEVVPGISHSGKFKRGAQKPDCQAEIFSPGRLKLVKQLSGAPAGIFLMQIEIAAFRYLVWVRYFA